MYRRELNLAISSAQSKITMYSFYLVYCYRVKHEKISSSSLGLSVMTLRECRVDLLFPDHVIR